MTYDGTTQVLLQPYVTISVEDETQTVVGVEIDWSDTIQNASQDGDLCWEAGGEMPPLMAVETVDEWMTAARMQRVTDSFTEEE